MRSCTRSSTSRRRPNCSFRRRGVCTPRARSRTSFLDRYAGGWQELFPSTNDETTYRGETIPFHGEVALLPWECEQRDGALDCRVRCERTPFLLERTLRFDGGLIVEERVTNEGDDAAHFTWGHHLVLGPPFLEPGSRLEIPARTIVTIPELWEDTARLEPGSGAHGLTRDFEKAAPSIFARSPGPRQRATTTCT